MKIFIEYEFTDWNNYINLERGNPYAANRDKQNDKNVVKFFVKEKYEGAYPVTLTVRPHFKNRRRDLDNYRIKGLIDGLVSAGVIKNDNLTCIDKIVIVPVFGEGPGVEVEITETAADKRKIEQGSKTGHWIKHDEIFTFITGETATGGVVCSECGHKTHNKLHVSVGCPYNYCPHCGARMAYVPDINDGKMAESEDKE